MNTSDISEVFEIPKFDSKSVILFNDAVQVARDFGFVELHSGHLLYSLLKSHKIQDRFFSDTNCRYSEFNEVFESILNKNYQDVNYKKSNVTPHEALSELETIIDHCTSWAEAVNKEVTVDRLYEEVMLSFDSTAWAILELMPNLDVKAVMLKLREINPLDTMKVTAQFAVNYNSLAREGRFDPISSRDDIIDRVFEVLGRRTKNNPCLVGESGVGKTAIVERIAQRLAIGAVPKYLLRKTILAVDVPALVSGAKLRGEFEQRLQGIIKEVSERRDIILFFDEIHMLADAGTSSEAGMNTLTMLKPYIANGILQIIGATTYNEYKKHLESDKAFERRIQKIQVNEPTVDIAVQMVRSVITVYNRFHNSTLEGGVIESAVRLSDRYITDRKLPDKAVMVIDETAARIKRELDKGINDTICISVPDIKKTVSKITGIDVADLDDSSRTKLVSLSDHLKRHVIGQDTAIEEVCKSIRRSRAGVRDPNRPIGSFLFVGPTGVGKTELTKALAIEFRGGVKNLVRFDMSEYMERHSVSKLIGSPPGYIGYGEGGRLTEVIKHNPYSIILFDEIEKAHEDIWNIMLQILDDGVLTDSSGNRVDFKNTIIILTSNAGYGAELMNKSTIGFSSRETPNENDELSKRENIAIKVLESTFKPEFLNRLDRVVVFNKLSREDSYRIAELIMSDIRDRLKDKFIELSWDSSLIEHVLRIGFSTKYGARNLKRKIQNLVEDTLADMIINGEIPDRSKVDVSYPSESVGLCVDVTKPMVELHKAVVMETVSERIARR